ncbi:MAG TPA: methyltransferase [Vicinamibacterales bacterium]|nr:methyltransferase [Vicinamibacterales bacterium]
MQYGVIPTSLAERLALFAGAVPLPLIDLSFGVLKARMIMAGVRLGIFEALAQESHTHQTLAVTLKLDASCLDLLLRSLVYAGYLELHGERYALSSLAKDTMITGARHDLTGFAQWHYTHWKFIDHLEELMRTGVGVDFHATMTDPEAWGHYQKAMLEIARFDAPILARHVPVRKGATRLLDVAGGHGLLGATIARRHSPMHATVIDLPAAIEHARSLAQHEGHADIVEHRPGDLMTGDFGTGWDVVLLSNILHHLTPQLVRSVVARVHDALTIGGTVAIWELERPARSKRPSEGDGVALFFRLISSAAAYSGEEYKGWLEDAGFTHTKIVRPRLRPGTVLVHARR